MLLVRNLINSTSDLLAQPKKDPNTAKRNHAQGHNFFENVKGIDFSNPDLNQAVIGLLFLVALFILAYIGMLNQLYIFTFTSS